MPKVLHFEIPAEDPERAVKFYEKVFGWKIKKWKGEFDYWLVEAREEDETGINGAIKPKDFGNCISQAIGVETSMNLWRKSRPREVRC